MSNLGTYQWLTTTSKKVGGPVMLLTLAGVTGATIYKGGEMIVKRCMKRQIRQSKKSIKTAENTNKGGKEYNELGL